MQEDASGAMAAKDARDEHFKWHWVRMALTSPNTIICSLLWFLLLISVYSYALFLPIIVHELGYSSIHAQLLTVPPNVCAFFAILALSRLSDKLQMRGPLIMAGCVLAIAGYAMLLTADRPAVKYGGTFLIATGVYPGTPLVQGWLANNLAPHYVRATGIGFQVSVANCAAFIATFAYLSKDAPRFVLGHSICIGALALCFLTTLGGVLYCRWENGVRDAGRRDHRLLDGPVDLLGYRHPSFRYTI